MKKITLIYILFLLPVYIWGQLKPITDQYILNPMMINPAFAGNREALNIAAFYRQQWTGIEGAPRTLSVAADALLQDQKLGLGLIVSNDKIGVRNETSLKTIYSYQIESGEGSISFGLGAGIMTTNSRWSELTATDPGDELYMIDSKTYVFPDFSFGVHYNLENYFAGFSIPWLLNYSWNDELNKYSIHVDPKEYYYLLNTGYLINTSEKIKLFPSTLLYFSPGNKFLFDLNASLNLMDRLWVGASYRNGRSIAGFFQVNVNEQLRLAYTYNFNLGELSSYSTGTYELMLRYEFKYKTTDIVNPLDF